MITIEFQPNILKYNYRADLSGKTRKQTIRFFSFKIVFNLTLMRLNELKNAKNKMQTNF